MILDGDFFDSGSWCGAKVACLERQQFSRLEFASDEVFRGLAGMMWFVSEKSLDTYFSTLGRKVDQTRFRPLVPEKIELDFKKLEIYIVYI